MKCQPGCTCRRHNSVTCPEGCTCGRHTSQPRHAYGPEWRAKIAATSRGRAQSAGQIAARVEKIRKHGMHRTPTYRSWDAMKQRCLNPNNSRYADYGGRGITVCDRWLDFANFFADMGVRPAGTTLGRAHGDDNYEPGKVRWETQSEQQRNRPNFKPDKRSRR